MKPLGSLLITIVFQLLLACGAENREGENVVYLNYTEDAIDSAYNQTYWAPNLELIFKQLKEIRSQSELVIGNPKRIQYGTSAFGQLDLYTPRLKDAPIHIYIHGGAWRGGNGAGLKAYNARKFVERGAMYIAPDYQLVQDADGSLFPMVDQLREAIVWIYKNAREYGGDPNRIYISGHSAGAHLGGVLVSTDWTEYGVPKNVIKGAFLSSGMYDLYPVSLSSRNEYVNFTEKTIEALSPVNYLSEINAPIILAYGTDESPEFQRQTKEFAELLKEQSKEVELHVLNGYNHFEIIVALEIRTIFPENL